MSSRNLVLAALGGVALLTVGTATGALAGVLSPLLLPPERLLEERSPLSARMKIQLFFRGPKTSSVIRPAVALRF